jgi:hypothetical protein
MTAAIETLAGPPRQEAPRMIPDTLADITLDWLADALAPAGAPMSDPPTTLTVEPVGTGAGFVGELARLRLRHRSGAERTLVAKLASPDPAVRRALNGLGLYRTEAAVYSELAPSMRLALPRCHFARCDAVSGSMLLLLEDLGDGHRFGDAMEGCSPDEALRVVRELAAHHAQWWNHPQLARLPWLLTRQDNAEVRVRAYRAALPLLEQRWGELLTPEFIHVARRYGEKLPALLDTPLGNAWTFVHGDFRLDNLAFATNASGRLTVFDWQTAYRGPGADDLSYFIVGSQSMEHRRAQESTLLDAYHAALCSNGVGDYSREELTRDYHGGLSRSLSVLVISGGVLDLTHPRGRRLVQQGVARIAAACADHGYAELLEAL